MGNRFIKKRFIVEIEVDTKTISKKYPNYKYNYNSPDELIKSLIKGFTCEGDTDMSKDGLKEWGYSKRVIGEVKMKKYDLEIEGEEEIKRG